MQLHLSVTAFRSHVPSRADTPNYVTLSIAAPEGPVASEHTSGEMVLVLDRSGSMMDSFQGRTHIQRVIAAARVVVDRLRPNDRLAIIGFDDRAKVVCPLTAGESRSKIADALAEFEKECTSGGGTSMAPALRAAMDEIRQNARNQRGARIVLLTDGQAGDEKETLDVVNTLEGQSIAALGFGTFKFAFMTEVCKPSKGVCEEIGGKDPSRVEKVFLAELQVAQNTVASNLRLSVRPSDWTQMRKAWIAHPIPTYLGGVVVGEDGFVTDVPVLERGVGAKVLFDVSHRRHEPGPLEALTFELRYDNPAAGVVDAIARAQFTVVYTDDPVAGTVDPAVRALHGRCRDEELRLMFEEARARGDVPEMERILDTMRKSDDARVRVSAKKALDTLRLPGGVTDAAADAITKDTKRKADGPGPQGSDGVMR